MNNKFLLNCLMLIFLPGFFIACSDDKAEGLTPEKATATYSNKLSTPANANQLTFMYSGHEMIGKDIYFETPDGSTATLTLMYVFPNQPETVLENVQLAKQADGNGYSFSGTATTTQGIGLSYEGVVTEGKLSLTLSDIQYPTNSLTQTKNWKVVHNAEVESYREQDAGSGRYITYYTYTRTAHIEIGTTNGLLSTLNGMILNPLLSNIFSLTLDQVNFLEDGNVTISYAGLPEETPISSMLMSYVTDERPASVWQTSPVNLATYYLEDDTVLYVLPHIDMIIQQIRNASTKANPLDDLDTQSLLALYAKLNKWSTEGIRLIVKPNPYKEYITASSISQQRQAGDYLLYIDKSEIQEIFALLDLLPLFLDEQTMTAPLSYVLTGMGLNIPEEYQALIDMLLGNMTLETLLIQLQQELDGGPFDIGLFLNK